MFSDVRGGGLASAPDVQSLFFLLKKIELLNHSFEIGRPR